MNSVVERMGDAPSPSPSLENNGRRVSPLGVTRGLLLAGLLGAGACSPVEVQRPLLDTYCDRFECSPSCAALRVEPCSIESESCQALVQKSVECVRGIEFDRAPDVMLVYPDENIPDASARVDAGVRDAGVVLMGDYRRTSLLSSSLHFADPQVVAAHHWNGAAHGLGLLAPDATWGAARSSTRERIAGTYRVMDQVLEVIVPADRDAVQQMHTLAHEMVHALQDQERDLDAWAERRVDAGDPVQPYRAYVEGEAELYALLALHLMLGLPISDDRLEELSRKSRKALLRYLRQAESPGPAAIQYAVYNVGLGLHLQRWMSGKSRATNRLAEDFPEDLAAWMRREPRSTSIELSCDDVEPLSDQTLARVTWFSGGADLLLPLFAKHFAVDGEPDFALAWEASGAWRGDCLEVYGEASTPAAPGVSVDGATGQADAGVSPALVDAGVRVPPTRVADVTVRWIMAFDDEWTARFVETALASADWAEQATTLRVGERVTLTVYQQARDHSQTPLADCWPLYPFDPDQVYLMAQGVSHWQHPEFALGSTRDFGGASIRHDGELVFGAASLFTPEWCQLPGDPPPEDPRSFDAVTENDPRLSIACERRNGGQLGVDGRRVFRCLDEPPGEWLDSDGKVVAPDLRELKSVGYDGTLLFDSGVFVPKASSVGPKTPEVGAVLDWSDADASTGSGARGDTLDAGWLDAGWLDAGWLDAGSRADGSRDAGGDARFVPPELPLSEQHLRLFDEGTLYLLRELPSSHDIAVRALPTGYWIAYLDDQSTGAYSLWFVDFRGHGEKVGDYPTWEAGQGPVPRSAALDAFGRLYVVTIRDGARLAVLDLDGSVDIVELPSQRTLVTGP